VLTLGYALRSCEGIAVNWGSILRVWLPLLAGLCYLYLFFVNGPGPHDLTRWIGLALNVVGLTGVILGRYTLGRSFSVKAKATELVTTGIYSRIRNPIYASGLIFIAGLILMIRIPVLSLLLVPIILMQIIRARREARVLEAKFGEAYRQYRDRTWF
jgi:protein-S-isoprenylcysteine O-methyltransferase Ste14